MCPSQVHVHVKCSHVWYTTYTVHGAGGATVASVVGVSEFSRTRFLLSPLSPISQSHPSLCGRDTFKIDRKKKILAQTLEIYPLRKTVPNHIFVTFVCILVVHRSEHVECNLESLQNRKWHVWRSVKTNSDSTILSHIILRSSLLYRFVFPNMQSTALSLWLNKHTRTCFIGMQIHICIWYARAAELNNRNHMLHKT